MNDIFTREKFTFFDGAMGTMLLKAGLATGDFPELNNFNNPEIVRDIYQQYIDAGAEIITTNTFSSNAFKMQDFDHSFVDSVKKGVAVAKSAVSTQKVALDIGPIGQLMVPMGTLSFAEAYDMFAAQIEAGAAAGADLVLVETMTDLYEAKAAVLAAKEICDLPVVCTLSFQKDGRTLSGADPLTAILTLEGLGLDVIGVNCSLGPVEMIPIIKQFVRFASVPVIAQPNAGMPELVKGETLYNMRADDFGSSIREMAELGVLVFGGCCGTNPEFIRSARRAVSALKPATVHPERITAVSSGSQTVVLGDDVAVIGERINPTGKKKLKAALRTRDFDYILNEAVNQRNAGAKILDVNAGLPEIDEKEIMMKIIQEIQAVVDLPLQIDSTDPKVIEAALRIYNGKALVNSVNGEEKSMKAIFPLVKKYGACVLGLTLDESGIPETAAGRFAIAEKIIQVADTYGIRREDVLIDCLVLTASTQQPAVMETLRAVRMVKEKLGAKTILGVSNVSFGLPRRDILNSTYLAMALACGLDAPIINPLSVPMMAAVHAFRVLANRDRDSESFVAAYADTRAPAVQTAAAGLPAETGSGPGERSLREIVIDGLRNEAAAMTEKRLETEDPMKIIEKDLMPALDVVGEKYEKGQIFLPQLMQAAETVKKAFDVIKSRISTVDENGLVKGKIILATVKGDIHDIGKNIVKVLLENYGYQIIDLGKDVAPETVVEIARKEKVKLVGLSALMTTTVKSMEDTIAALKNEGVPCIVMVGGAVLTQEYADMIKADHYARDAQEAVRIAGMVFK